MLFMSQQVKAEPKAQPLNKQGYYTVNIDTDDGKKVPYIVYASSDFIAARMVHEETGYMAKQHEVEGPYSRL